MNIFRRINESKRFLFGIIIAGSLMVLLLMVNLKHNKAFGNSTYDKQCISIEILEGDSLWSIAERFYVPECGTMKEYIKEIKNTNSLHSDLIHAGNYLLIPYYVAE